jgi:GNAT superfamily N-acetyltransferase
VSIKVEPASEKDAFPMLELRLALEAWLESKGVEQWGRNEVSLADVQRQVAAAEWHVVRSARGQVIGALRLLWSDEPVWQHQNEPAAYVHGLMADREHAPKGLGKELLAWAEEQARAADVPMLRLDCVESNAVLRSYYRRLGFSEVGRRDFDGPWHSAVLFEKQLTRAQVPLPTESERRQAPARPK